MNDRDQVEMVHRLGELILGAVPAAQPVEKYGGTLYTLKADEKEGQFCGVFRYKSHVQLAFSQGASLDDPENLLEGNGKQRRHVNIRDQINEAALTALVREAAGISI